MFPDNENKTILANLRKRYNPTFLDWVDGWIEDHPKIVLLAAGSTLGFLVLLAFNLGFGRPWF